MKEALIARSSRPTGVSWVVTCGAILVVASALALVAAPLGYNTGTFSVRTALLTVLRWGAYGAIAAALVSLVGVIVTLRRPKGARAGLALAVISLLLGATLVAVPGRYRLGPPKPPIHDISTDAQDPPQFVAVLPLRANAPNTSVYGGEKIASQQRAAYADIQPFTMNLPPGEAFDRALAAVQTMGWDLVAADRSAGRIEATDTTLWFRFKDDVVVRIRPEGSSSRIDVRSLSRVGGGDVGTNARRIRAYLQALSGS